ncbi:MAG: hypothetical protein AB2A00_00480 [Myxococcota bacterium]
MERVVGRWCRALSVTVVTACAVAPSGNGSGSVDAPRPATSEATPGTVAAPANPPARVEVAPRARTFALLLNLPPTTVPPRMVEAWLEVEEGWRMTSSQAGRVAQEADKSVRVQERNGRLRVVVLSSGNLNTLANGPLALLALEGDGGSAVPLRVHPRSNLAPGGAVRPGELAVEEVSP